MGKQSTDNEQCEQLPNTKFNNIYKWNNKQIRIE